MSELYLNLSLRYRNSWKVIDSNGLKGIILFNETYRELRTMWAKYKYCDESITGYETIMVRRGYGGGFLHKKPIYHIDLIEFVKDALTKGHDWKLYGQPEWEAIEPVKKKKFINPKKRNRNVRTNSSK